MFLDKRFWVKAFSLILLAGSTSVGCGGQPPESDASQSKLAIAATRKLQLGDLEGALKDYDRAIAQNPKEADAYVNRGIVRDELGQHAAAIADYTQALTLNPDLHLAYYNRANAYVQEKQYQKAIADYDKAIELEPDYAYAYANRGSAQLKVGDSQSAISDLKQASEIFASKNDRKNVQRLERMLTSLTTVPADR
ncbi:tetratricopeptide repeat protein [Altericista sp. CCNU0014]|uniref:tetratricopeptide repeat protein n=1 Tax=Altericista sp. CCNU0014 TaxID=3082949 RepID=UPI0038508BD6